MFDISNRCPLGASCNPIRSIQYQRAKSIVVKVAFVAQPDSKYPVQVLRVEPSAVPKETGNIFIVRASLTGAPQTWWRPGMSGLCKIDAGRGTLFWILTHRTVDFLRLNLWW
jgi:hypothetical protein